MNTISLIWQSRIHIWVESNCAIDVYLIIVFDENDIYESPILPWITYDKGGKAIISFSEKMVTKLNQFT